MFQLGFQGYKLRIPNPIEYRAKDYQEYEKNKEVVAGQDLKLINDDELGFLGQAEWSSSILSQYGNWFGAKKKKKKKKKKGYKKKKKKMK